jgi:hypothetical protein
MALALTPASIFVFLRNGFHISEDQRNSPHGVAEGGWRKAVYALEV